MVLATATACSPAAGPPRNVLLISIDTLRADRLGCYGYARPTSPFLDELAAESLLLENAVAQAPWTLPSHATMLTGLYPHHHGVIDESRRLADEVPTLATMLKKAGFATGAIVNSHWISEAQGLRRGYDTFDRFEEVGNRGREITELAGEWLARFRHRPFFLFLHYYDVHSSYSAGAPYREMFAGDYEGIADGSTDQLLKVRDGEVTYDERDHAHVSDLYDAEIRQLDDTLRVLFGKLEELDLDGNTLVVLTADHGEEFMEHGGILHGRTLYEEVLRVPLMFRGPGVPRGRRVRELAMVVDVVPTVLGRLEIPPDGPLDGIDLIAALDGDGARRAFAAADWRNQEPDSLRMARTLRHKLYLDRLSGEARLFDLVEDPGERTDVGAEHPELVEFLRGELEGFLAPGDTPGSAAPRSEEVLEMLRKLGYFDD